ICASDCVENPPVLVLNSLEIPALLLCIERCANALPWNDVAAEKHQQLREFGISTGHRDGLMERKILANSVLASLDRGIDGVQSLLDRFCPLRCSALRGQCAGVGFGGKPQPHHLE